MKKKIAIINQRYGAEVNGGSEYYTKKLAEHLTEFYDVEVLTTTARDYDTWAAYYQEGVQIVDGVRVRRFPIEKKRNISVFRIVNKLLRTFPCFWRVLEPLWLKEQGPYCPEMVGFINANKNKYDVFVFVTYLYYTTVSGAKQVKEKAILVPTAHDEYCIYLHMYQELFTQVKGIVYLTVEEKEFVEQLFGNAGVPNVVAGSGIDIPASATTNNFRKKYGIKGDYIIYVGRVDTSKKCDMLFEYFSRYKNSHKSELKLVVVGKLMMNEPEDKDIICLGFISEEEKYDAMARARLLVMPSEHESLSLAVLEAMAMGVPVLANSDCKVLKAHCEKSGAGLSYKGYNEFDTCLENVLKDEGQYKKMQNAGKRYVEKKCSWDNTIKEYSQILEL